MRQQCRDAGWKPIGIIATGILHNVDLYIR
jgi:hypothetical protein